MSLLSKFKNRSFKDIIMIIKSKFLTISKGYTLDLKKYNTDVYNEKYNFYEFILMEMCHLKEINQIYGNEIGDYKYEILKKRIEEKSVYIPYMVVDKEGNLYGYYHLAIGDTWDGTINSNVHVSENEVYLFDDYTFVERRGHGSHKFAVYSRLKLAKKKGYSKAIVNILKGNLYSEKSYQGLGFTESLIYYYIHFLNFKKTFIHVIKK